MNGSMSTGYPLCSAWVDEDENATLSGPLRIPISGGVQQVTIKMLGAYNELLAWVVCTRGGCTLGGS